MEETIPARKILFMPFLKIPSGHYQAAKAIIDGIYLEDEAIQCETVDILSYSLGPIERIVSGVYLEWIKRFPGIYSRVYRMNVYTNLAKTKRFRLYESIFLRHIRRLLNEQKPNFIVCTHGLPSYLLNQLKKNGEVTVPVMNVYTDFFIHQVWGIETIDYHLVPTMEVKSFLLNRGVREERIYLTGIPIHPKIPKAFADGTKSPSLPLSVLVTGGNLGVGSIEQLVLSIGKTGRIHYSVLCGKNISLLQKIKAMQNPHVKPLGYIECREKMNKLYEENDAVLTKPGGVTLSECLFKRKPVFIYHSLPGQEEINLQALEKHGLVVPLYAHTTKSSAIEEKILAFFSDENEQKNHMEKLESYLMMMTKREPWEIVRGLLGGTVKNGGGPTQS
ncbi:UDP-glucuronosyltransferase [Neobacillus notoginsengisoli]|uniref:UDP-glucuronosyltransferase n=1 Tax=Neobacillus notoginsengisoli TaxID=1578198 RepID=A0A417YX17_9BACI|nr:glycosyltransferase [Neobacillus notoginsengisoli]RHW42069.1 UDP-glucuronosyltransferase [Neobacillus notoginsengisoli]